MWELINIKCLIHALVYSELYPDSLTLKIIHSLAPTFLHKSPSLYPVLQPSWIFICNFLMFTCLLFSVIIFFFLLHLTSHFPIESLTPHEVQIKSWTSQWSSCVTPGRSDLQSFPSGSFLVIFISALSFWSCFNLFLPKCFPVWQMYKSHGIVN